MQDLDQLRTKWEIATSKLAYGAQHVFHDVLTLVAEGKKNNLVYAQDYGDGGECLVNAAGSMLTTKGGAGIPMRHYGEVVGLYDRINREFEIRDINGPDKHVSPLAAEILLQWFSPLKEIPAPVESTNESFAQNVPYVEPTDEDFAEALNEMLTAPVVEDPLDNLGAPVTLEDAIPQVWRDIVQE